MGNALLPPGPVTAGFGTTMASAGDVNGDGYGDVIVGGREVAQVFLGGAKGMAPPRRSRWRARRAATRWSCGARATSTATARPMSSWAASSTWAPERGFAAQTNFTPGAFAADFVGDNDGDGLTDFAANQAIYPGTPAGIDGNHTLLVQAGEFVFATAGDIDGDGYCDTVSSTQPDGGLPGT